MKDIDFRLDPKLFEEPDDPGKAMMQKIKSAMRAQTKEEGRRQGYDEGYAAGWPSGYNQALEDLLTVINDFVRGNKIG